MNKDLLIVVIAIIVLMATVAYAMRFTTAGHVLSPASQQASEKDLTYAGYGVIAGKSRYVSHLFEKDLKDAKKRVAKRNAQNFIDDRDDVDELVEVFYRKVR